MGRKKVAVIQKWLFFRGWSLKITSNIKKQGIMLAVVDRWPLFGDGPLTFLISRSHFREREREILSLDPKFRDEKYVLENLFSTKFRETENFLKALSVCLSSVYLSACQSVCQSICQSVCQTVCLSSVSFFLLFFLSCAFTFFFFFLSFLRSFFLSGC